ncbi:MAG TPA: hypothetical protein VL856_11650 [Acidimicrobiia bacterium]|nr:hypothetical protein [Acidimicrobiia bacterium]
MATTEHDDLEVASRVEPPDGDDITVIPEPADAPKRSRRRVVLLSALAVVLIAAVIAIVVGTRDDSSSQVQAASPAPAVTSPPAVNKHKPAPAKNAKRKHATKPVTRVTTAPVLQPETPVTSPAVAPTVPPATMPAQPQASPITVLQWNVPQSVSVKSGATTTIAVSAYNPSAGVVTLPVPLSCAPRLQHDEVCPEMAQLINPGETANATYTIDAKGVKPGTYTLKVEGVAPITVTVTPS